MIKDKETKTVKIFTRMNNTNLDNNQDILTSPLYKMLSLIECIKEDLKIDSVITEGSTLDYDIIISRYMGDDIKTFPKGKPIYEFHYCGLNEGWFFERYTDESGITHNMTYETEQNHINTIDNIKELYGIQYFIRPLVNYYVK